MPNAGTQMRRESDSILRQILTEQQGIRAAQITILEKLGQRETYQRLLEQRMGELEEEVEGPDKKSGLKAAVQKHEDRINQVMGGMAVLTFIGAMVGWFADKLIKVASSR